MNIHSQHSLAEIPLMNHSLNAPPVFSPENLIEAVKAKRNIQEIRIPDICILEFDGDLTEKLRRQDELTECKSWPCFHTRLWCWQQDRIRCGIVPQTIGGPYTVLIAEQLAVCGVKAIIGLASAGRVHPSLPLPSVVIATGAIRDEGVSYHYLPPSETVEATPSLVPHLMHSLENLEQPVRSGLIWTTDAPYRETNEDMAHNAERGALAVEMQAASLFSFGIRKHVPVALVAHVTNAMDHDGRQFEKGAEHFDIELLSAICEGTKRWIEST
ncbi:MAG: nucleoside phosphorylase [Candidatus Omnitrophota bacterium]